MTDLLSSKEAAKLLGMTINSFYQRVKDSKRGLLLLSLPTSIGSGSARFYSKEELLIWKKERKKVLSSRPAPNQRGTGISGKIHIYMKNELKEKLKEEADQSGISLNQLINILLEDAL